MNGDPLYGSTIRSICVKGPRTSSLNTSPLCQHVAHYVGQSFLYIRVRGQEFSFLLSLSLLLLADAPLLALVNTEYSEHPKL